MSPEQIFLGVLLLLHLSEYCLWVPSGSAVFRRRGRGWETVTRGAIIETRRGSLHWVYPLPGLSRAYRVEEPALLGSGSLPDGASRKAEAFDPAASERRRLEVVALFRPLRWVSLGLTILILAGVPLGLQCLGWGPTLRVGIPVILLLMGCNAVVLFQRHRSAFPEASDDRWRLVLSACLSPLAATRSWDLAQKDALAGFHPVAVAAALPGFRDWEGLASTEWRHHRFPESSDALAPGVQGVSEVAGPTGSDAVLGSLAAIARARGVDPRRWEAPPEPDDPSHTRYCPRCRAQFTGRADTCNACRGIPLRGLSPR